MLVSSMRPGMMFTYKTDCTTFFDFVIGRATTNVITHANVTIMRVSYDHEMKTTDFDISTFPMTLSYDTYCGWEVYMAS